MDGEIVITGACGFLGSHCVDAALERGLNVHAICQYRADGTVGHMEGYHDRVTIHRTDLAEITWLRDPYGKWSLEQLPIINCAALVSVPYSRHMPNEYWRVNADAVMKLAQLCPRLVQVSTSEVFDGRSAPYRVDSTRCPVTPYGASKAAAEVAVLGYSRTARVVRIFNLYGPRQYPRAVHPIFIRAALAIRGGSRPTLAGPKGSRAFLYAPWVAEQLVSIATSETDRLVQLASYHCVKIADLWGWVCQMVGVDPDAADWEPDAAHNDVPELWGLSSDGFTTPRYHGADLRATIAWYENNHDYASERAYQ